MTHQHLLLVPVLLVAFVATTAHAQDASYPLTSDSQLRADGWTLHEDGVSSSFGAEGLVMDSNGNGYSEWMLRQNEQPGSPWWSNVSHCSGWSVTARLRVDRGATQDCFGGPGIWIHDGGALRKIGFDDGSVGLTYPNLELVPFDTEGFHTYTVRSFGGKATEVLADGEVILALDELNGGAGSEVLMFGDLGGCSGARITWESFSYSAQTPTPEGLIDIDEDGVDDRPDNCPDVANPDQLDSDGDCVGDVCDPCPNDLVDDIDGDGQCNDVDPCPNDPEDVDADENGICDVDERSDCFGGPGPIPPMPGFDCEQGGPFWPEDNFDDSVNDAPDDTNDNGGDGTDEGDDEHGGESEEGCSTAPSAPAPLGGLLLVLVGLALVVLRR